MIDERTNGSINDNYEFGVVPPTRQEYLILQLFCCQFIAEFSTFFSRPHQRPNKYQDCAVVACRNRSQCATCLCNESMRDISFLCFAHLFAVT